ncbi:hypothetical protein DFP72DRAFT_176992 [Ephemerocybe angulata]|uniref:Cytochrome P450 n=1 Tax=Ephemerocybe angulata TaxID=980116 RepID=A0A8H6I487_9AGAR|nr:hypothetical protein DFP72DRAFT_176992 [Tulosesus angulatus]
MLLTIAFALLVAALSVFLCSVLKSRGDISIAHSNLDSIRACLSGEGSTIGQLLQERSRANTRLLKAFRLSNTFVSGDEEVHSTFVTHAKGLLKDANKVGWRRFRDLATRAIEHEFESLDHGATHFDVFIQSVCLRVILVGLLGVDASVESFAQDDIATVTSHINDLWSLSKQPQDIPSHLLPDLSASLRRLVPDADRYPNPVDFVIPSWETLWRVVAIAVAHSSHDKEMSEAMSRLYARPDIKTFNSEGSGVSPKNIVDETMRMYPPSKHIGRMKFRPFARILPSFLVRFIDTFTSDVVRQNFSADVNGVQQSVAIWGEDANKFKPSRFTNTGSSSLSKEQRDAHSYVFGGGPLRCIGASWAPVAAAVMCSAVLSLTGNDQEEVRIVRGETIGSRSGWGDWFVEKI